MGLVKSVYQISSDFPKHELFGLTYQLRRSAVSIPSNIAEDNGRSTTPGYIASCKLPEVPSSKPNLRSKSPANSSS